VKRYLLVAASICASAQLALADEADELVDKGQELGKQGEWSLAIAAFKRAEVLKPRAVNACLLGLAYTRRELWAQAELFFARCHARAKAGDEAPEWVADAEATLASKLAAAGIPLITIKVTPPAEATISVSGFEPDEILQPGAHHLSPGRYSIEVAAPGYFTQTRDVVVVVGQPQQVAFEMHPVLIHNDARDTRMPWYVIGSGAALLAAGTIVDLAKVQPLRDEIAKSQYELDLHGDDFRRWRAITIGLWGAGAVAVGVGAWLELHRRELPVMITASSTQGGASVGVEWHQ
jgi:hypothetical protein